MSNLQRYGLFGIAFGLCFPLLSIPLDLLLFKGLSLSLDNTLQVHSLNPLHFVIDTAPLFLGLAFAFAGKKQDDVIEYHQQLQVSNEKLVKTMKENESFILSQNTFLENTVTLRTAQLSEANEELKQIVEELHSTVELVNKQKEELDAKNQNITASIRYALTLQNSILPTENLLQLALKDYFVFYKPKDIVSGDFYFCYYQEPTQTTFVSVIDCTGHGVPGAFMSILVHNLLLEAIEIREMYSPSEIFNYVSQTLVKFLRRNNPNNTDGFDAILCSMKEQSAYLDLVFVTTKLPLYVYHHTLQRLLTYYGDVVYVGVEGKEEAQSFNEQNIKLYKGDQFFLASDGITDQPNEERKRWGSKRFVQLLEQIASENCIAQQYHVEQALVAFAQKAPQRDDITVLGVKIS